MLSAFYPSAQQTGDAHIK